MARLLYLAAVLGAICTPTVSIQDNVCQAGPTRSYACNATDQCAPFEDCYIIPGTLPANYGRCLVDRCYRLCFKNSDCRGDKVHPNGDSRMAVCGEFQEGEWAGQCSRGTPALDSPPLPGLPLPDPPAVLGRSSHGKACYRSSECDRLQGQVCLKNSEYNSSQSPKIPAGVCTKPTASQANRAAVPAFHLSLWPRSVGCLQDFDCDQAKGEVCYKNRRYDEHQEFRLIAGTCSKLLTSQANRIAVPTFHLPLWRKSVGCRQDFDCDQAKGEVCNKDRKYDKDHPFRLFTGTCSKPVKNQANRALLPPFHLPRWLNGDECRRHSDRDKGGRLVLDRDLNYDKYSKFKLTAGVNTKTVSQSNPCQQDFDCDQTKGQVCKKDRRYKQDHPFRLIVGTCSSQASRVGTPLRKIAEWLSNLPGRRQPVPQLTSRKSRDHLQCSHNEKDNSISGVQPPVRIVDGGCSVDAECPPGSQCMFLPPKYVMCVMPPDAKRLHSTAVHDELPASKLSVFEKIIRHTSSATISESSSHPVAQSDLQGVRLDTDVADWNFGAWNVKDLGLEDRCPSGAERCGFLIHTCESDLDRYDTSKWMKSLSGPGICSRDFHTTPEISITSLIRAQIPSTVTTNLESVRHQWSQSCIRDSDCTSNHICIEMTGKTTRRCLMPCKEDSDCPPPYQFCFADLFGAATDPNSSYCSGIYAVDEPSPASSPTSAPSSWLSAMPPLSHSNPNAATKTNLPRQLVDCTHFQKPDPSTFLTATFSVSKRSEAPLVFPTLAAIPIEGPTLILAPNSANVGTFAVVGSSGVPAMHAALMPNGKVVFLDRVEYFTELRLTNGQLAYSSLYDPATKGLTPLPIVTNAFCCAGTFLADGRVLAVGGSDAMPVDPTVAGGFDAIRYLAADGQGGWTEPGHKLSSNRWYASSQMLEDGSIFVVSGSKTGLDQTNFAYNNPTYEILNRDGISNGNSITMDILVRNQPYFLYPFLHLLKDGNVFVFVARSSQIFNPRGNQVVKELPDMPGSFRTYGNTGGSVLLPLTIQNDYEPEVMICGGGASQKPTSPAEATCGRIQPMSANPGWRMTAMPEGRCMVEGTLLPDGTVLWVNGAIKGAQGWGIASEPAFEALIYKPTDGSWKAAGRTAIPRLYHSVALLLLDGTVLISGSNPNEVPVLAAQIDPGNPMRAFPTDFSVEIFTPPYLIGDKALRRPTNVRLSTQTLTPAGGLFNVNFDVVEGVGNDVKVVLYHGGFITHSLHMGARMINLDHEGFKMEQQAQSLQVKMPEARHGYKVVPPGPYVVYVVVDGIPAVGQFVMVQ